MRMGDLWHGRLMRFVLATFLSYAIAAWWTDAPQLLLVLNGLVMSIAAGVCVAYAPVFLIAIAQPVPAKSDYLGAGIFLGWLSMLAQRTISLIARDLGYPEIYNTDYMTLCVFLGLLGGLLHLWAPNAVDGRIPRAKWVSTGIYVAIGAFVTFLAWNAHLGVTRHPLVELR